MNFFLADTDVVSIVFRGTDPRKAQCGELLADRQVAITFMTLAELLVWPRVNQWGPQRRSALEGRVKGYTILLPDEDTCRIWAEVRAECQAAGSPIAATDAWMAAIALQWDLELVTGNFRDYTAVSGLKLVPIE